MLHVNNSNRHELIKICKLMLHIQVCAESSSYTEQPYNFGVIRLHAYEDKNSSCYQ